jgi:hypothetical protein
MVDEPDDVALFLKESLPHQVWDDFLNVDNPASFSSTPHRHQLWVSGLIQWHYRRLALDEIVAEGLDREFSEAVFIRSDYLFETPLPDTRALNPASLVVMDGENYGGANDRLLIFPMNQIASVREIFDVGSLASGDKRERLMRFMAGNRYKNPERLLKFQMKEAGLLQQSVAIPQLGYCVRPADETSRWSLGLYSKKRDLYLKYPTEFVLARLTVFRMALRSLFRKALPVRPLTTRRPRYLKVVTVAGHHKTTVLAPLLLALGEGTLAILLWRKAAGKTLRKLGRRRQLSTSTRGKH